MKIVPKMKRVGCVVTLYKIHVRRDTDLSKLGVRRDVNGRGGRRLTFETARAASAFFADAQRAAPRYVERLPRTLFESDSAPRGRKAA